MIVLQHFKQLLTTVSRMLEVLKHTVSLKKKDTIFESSRDSYLAQVLGKYSTPILSIFLLRNNPLKTCAFKDELFFLYTGALCFYGNRRVQDVFGNTGKFSMDLAKVVMF